MISFKLDEYDLLLISALREDARLSLRDLSSIVGLSAPAIASRLKRLEGAGIIQAYRVIIGEKKFGLSIEARILVDVPVGLTERFILEMDKYLGVTELNRVTGAFGYELTGSFTDSCALNDFVRMLESTYGRCQVSVILKREITPRCALGKELAGV